MFQIITAEWKSIVVSNVQMLMHGAGLLLWLAMDFSLLPSLIIAEVAPGTTHRPCVTSSTTSFGARVFTVSAKFVQFD